MYLPCRASLCLVSVLFSAAVQAAPLTICAEPDNLPFSGRETGFEVQAAHLLAQDIGRPLQVVYVAQRTPDFLRTTIISGRCDALMSVPTGFRRLATTKPWYRAGYVAVARSSAGVPPAALDDARLGGLRIGVPGQGTPPALAQARHGRIQNLHAYSLFDSEKLVKDVERGTLDIAYVWGPFAGWYAAQQPGLTIATLPPSDGAIPLAFALSIGVRPGNDELLRELDAAIGRKAAELTKILDRWHLPREHD
jgi:mxaJ protein